MLSTSVQLLAAQQGGVTGQCVVVKVCEAPTDWGCACTSDNRSHTDRVVEDV